MRITIKYEASWRNSFLDGTNNGPLPKNGRSFIGSMTKLAKRDTLDRDRYPNFIQRKITIDTIMGILNRLIGDQRKLYQSRNCQNYFFSDLEKYISFDDQPNDNHSEMIYIRNMEGSFHQKLYTGMIKKNDPIFNSDYSSALWGVLKLDLDNLCEFIKNADYEIKSSEIFDPTTVLQIFNELNELKAIDSGSLHETLQILKEKFPEGNYVDVKQKTKPVKLYCSAIYLQIKRLTKKYDVSNALSKNGFIAGISKNGFTPKDFMAKYGADGKKLIWGNPYQLTVKMKGQGEVIYLLTKVNGTLNIFLDIADDKAKELKNMIEAAGVSSFYLGKKGLAYVDIIR